MKKPISKILQIAFLLMAGCNLIPETEIVSTSTPVLKSTPTNEVTETASPSPTVRPTNTRIAPTVTPVVREISQNFEEIPLCASKGQPVSLPANTSLPGTIVFQRGSYQGVFTYDGKTQKVTQIDPDPNQEYFVFGYSPNGEWLAYSPSFSDENQEQEPKIARIKLISTSGKTVETSLDLSVFDNEVEKIDPNYRLVDFTLGSHWVNDQLINGTLYSAKPGISHIYIYPKVFDPFSGSWESSLMDSLYERYPSYPFDFSPDLRYSFYQAGTGLRLTNLQDSSEVWKNKDGLIRDVKIRWVPNGDYAIAGMTEGPKLQRIILVSEKGEETRVSLISENEIYFEDFAASDDGRYIAVTTSFSDDEFLVYDVSQQKFMLRCPYVGPASITIPVWSPDSHYIAYQSKNSPAQVLDIQTGVVYEMKKNFIIVDWK
jgi:WD40 repeat protein